MKGIETYEGKQIDIFISRKAHLKMAIDDAERYIQEAKERITEKHKEIDMLDFLTATLKERIQKE